MKGQIDMGMAASQARFLGLTARKSNVEYEGQQINQQRTTLSNQSAAYYTELLGMSVPTVPSVDDYTSTVYTFEDGALSNTVTALIASTDGTYSLSYLRSYTDDFAIVSSTSSIVTKSTDETTGDTTGYSIGSNTLRTLGAATPEEIASDAYLSTLTDDEVTALLEEEALYFDMLEETYDTSNWYVRYTEDSSTGEQVPYFYNGDSLEDASYSANGHSQSNINCYTVGSATVNEEVKGESGCVLEQDSSGRYINISIPVYDSSGTATGTYTTYALTTTTATDQDAYNDAMNQYEYECYEYDQALNEINAKIEIIQEQDKTLELQLTELDTEQSAISTEMDSVSAVIDANIESTFATFS